MTRHRVVSVVALGILTVLPFGLTLSPLVLTGCCDCTSSTVEAKPEKEPLPVKADEGSWGTLKGRVVFDGDPPARKKIDQAIIDRNTDKAFCTKDGDILSDALVVDPKTKGVR